MKRIILTVVAICSAAILAETNIVLTTQFSDGSTNSWTQKDLVDALGLMNRKYHRDMLSESGRRQWHGEKLGQYLLTNKTTKVIHLVSLYADGYTHTSEAAPSKPKDPEAALKAKLEAEKRAEEVRRVWEAANLPPELAALRAAQRESAKTNTVTVVEQL
jgi:hypothetical protein